MRKNLEKLTLILLILFLASCAKFQPRPLSPEQTAADLESRNLDDPKLKEFIETNLNRKFTQWPLRSWDFSMLTLAALYYHPDLDIARARRQVADAGIITAGAIPNPTVGTTPGFIANPGSGVSPWLYGFSFDIPIETAGKRGHRLARASHLAAAARFRLAVTAWKVRSRLRASLLDLYNAEAAATLRRRQLAVQEKLAQLLAARLAQGEIPRPELTQAQIDFDRARLSLQESQRQVAENRVNLAQALGLPLNALRGVEMSYGFLGHPPANLPSEKVRRQALFTRADILAALSEYEATQAALQLEIAKQYPDIHLGPGYKFDDGENKWTFGLAVTLPVFNRNQGPIAEAAARRTEAAARFGALQAGVIGELERAWAGYTQSLKKLETAEDLLRHQKQQEQSVRAKFAAGESDHLTLLGSQLEYYAAAESRLAAFYLAQQALGLLEDAIQRPLSPAEQLPEAPEKNPRIAEEGYR